MGILARPAEIVRSLPLPKGFSVCELGNQFYRADGGKSPAREWYASLGAAHYTSIDANGQATWFADLNHPVATDHDFEDFTPQLFDLVTDFGTGEHIFNQAQVFITLHDLCKVGGYIVIDRPMAGLEDHCFYSIHPTLLRDIAEANGYSIVHLERHAFGDGELLLGVFRKERNAPFQIPNQGKYKAMLAAAEPANLPGPNGDYWVNAEFDEPLRKAVQQTMPMRIKRGAALRPVTPEPPMIVVAEELGDTITVPHYVTYKVNRIKRGDVLIDLIRRNGWTRGAEIGVLNGENVFFKVLDAVPEIYMIAVDQWSETDKDYGDLSQVGLDFCAKAQGYDSRAGILHGNSAEMAEYVGHASLDFVFIDASHDYESVKADIAAWTPKVKPGGMVLGHDWNPERFPGVIQAVTERFGQPQLFPDHVWGVQV